MLDLSLAGGAAGAMNSGAGQIGSRRQGRGHWSLEWVFSESTRTLSMPPNPFLLLHLQSQRLRHSTLEACHLKSPPGVTTPGVFLTLRVLRFGTGTRAVSISLVFMIPSAWASPPFTMQHFLLLPAAVSSRAPIRTILNYGSVSQPNVWTFVIVVGLFRGLGNKFPLPSPITTSSALMFRPS